ncbi:hypothetical protein BDN70DRAFT_935619 [Pholiota conissans]|uniref:Uncharacterized protein n=1 Tax=Pholiota conissans TaxID=109636 RepID=A0A9P5YWA1_9AGAR|nr:hypothetical protein BDN70DRAFT_935619 [Pholiota conissans]
MSFTTNDTPPSLGLHPRLPTIKPISPHLTSPHLSAQMHLQHTILTTKLLPRLPIQSTYAHRVAATTLRPNPFLALHLPPPTTTTTTTTHTAITQPTISTPEPIRRESDDVESHRNSPSSFYTSCTAPAAIHSKASSSSLPTPPNYCTPAAMGEMKREKPFANLKF